MKKLVILPSLVLSSIGFLSAQSSSFSNGLAPDQTPAPLHVVATFDQQLTGVAVSNSGRIFVNFPNWADGHTASVEEVMPDKSTALFPDATWNDSKAALSDPANHFVSVQSVYADDANHLWILDPASPQFKGVVSNGAKLVEVDLATNQVNHIYRFDPVTAPAKSYLNDVRIDNKRQFAYISDSGLGAILVLNLQTGGVRRVLNQLPETMGTPGYVLQSDEHALTESSGDHFAINCDGIALNLDGSKLYFEAPTNGKLYSIPTDDLRDISLDDAALEKRVKMEGNIGPADGFCTGPNGEICYTSVEDHAVKRFDPTEVPATVIIADDQRLCWPDSIVWTVKGLYVTASQIPRMPRFNGGQDLHQGPYQLFLCQPFSVAAYPRRD